MPRLNLLPWAAATVIGLGSTGAQAAFTITLDLEGVDLAYQTFFDQAKTFWEGVITGYRENVGLSGLTIVASTRAIDGTGKTLGQAGPTSGGVFGSFSLATAAAMQFDSADVPTLVSNDQFDDVVRHEMAHALGFGTLWANNRVYTDGSGRYIGALALDTYRIEFSQPGATWIPIELGGDSGTRDGHWDEVDNGGGRTGITDGQGRDMRFELMTGWLNAPTFVSRTTAASFHDIGYTVNLSAVPEPAALALWLLGLPLLAGAAARHRRTAG